MASGPLVSCLMVTRGDFFPAELAIACYRKQTYPNRELVIVCAEPNSVLSRRLPELNDPSIRYIETPPMSLGELRNSSVAAARGSLVCTWDDDDLHGDRRIELQLRACLETGARAHFLSRLLIWWPERQLLGITGRRKWENSMLVQRDALPLYPSLPFSEDTPVVEELIRAHPTADSDEPELYCYVVNARNTSSIAHFEGIFEHAEWVFPNYDENLMRLSGLFPVKRYSDILLAKAQDRGAGIVMNGSGQPMVMILEEGFGDEVVKADGMYFKTCTFDETTLSFGGGAVPVFEECRMKGVKIQFLGSAANTVHCLRHLQQLGIVAGL